MVVELNLPPLYPIIDSELNPHTLDSVLNQFVLAGITFVQVREKRASSREFLSIALQAIEVARSHPLKVIVNDRVDIALLANADGVHLGQEDLRISDARRLLGPHKIIGASTHNLAQALEAQQSTADYVAIGPVYRTSSKEKPDPLVGWEELITIRKHVTKPLVAIGGITTKNARKLFDLGVDSVAVIRDLLSTREVSHKIREFLDLAANKESRT